MHPELTGETRLSRMDKVERVMKMVKRMSPRKKRREGGGGRAGGPGELESPDTLCDELCRFSLCISGEKLHLKVVCVYVFVCVCAYAQSLMLLKSDVSDIVLVCFTEMSALFLSVLVALFTTYGLAAFLIR